MAISNVLEDKRRAFIICLEGATMEMLVNSTKSLPPMGFPLLERLLSVTQWF